jgi:hypothetical protein
MPDLEIHYDPGGEWAALYVDGRLERVGDSYLAEEKAFEILGVKTVQDNAFLRGQHGRDGCAQTLDELAAYRTQRDVDRAEAARLREEGRPTAGPGRQPGWEDDAMRLSDLDNEVRESICVHHASGHFAHEEATARLVATGLTSDQAAEALTRTVDVALFFKYKTFPPELATA